MINSRTDLHVHTDNSPDAKHGCTILCEAGVTVGLSTMAITDHCEVDIYESGKFELSCKQSFFEAAKAKAIFKASLNVLRGIELGQPNCDFAKADKIVGKYDYDVVLASLHNLSDREDFYYLDYSLPENEPYALLDRYFDGLLEICKWGNFDVLAHLTYPLRYITGKQKIEIDLSRFNDKINRIFALLVEKGKALEVNTSGLRTDYGKTLPDLDLIKRYKALGGFRITTGSDAHCCEDVGSGIDEGIKLIKQAGFDAVTIYKCRKPYQIKL